MVTDINKASYDYSIVYAIIKSSCYISETQLYIIPQSSKRINIFSNKIFNKCNNCVCVCVSAGGGVWNRERYIAGSNKENRLVHAQKT